MAPEQFPVAEVFPEMMVLDGVTPPLNAPPIPESERTELLTTVELFNATDPEGMKIAPPPLVAEFPAIVTLVSVSAELAMPMPPPKTEDEPFLMARLLRMAPFVRISVVGRKMKVPLLFRKNGSV